MRSPGQPTYPFVPRSQIKHSYGLAISSARDNLDCRWIETIFITILVRNAIGNTRACATMHLRNYMKRDREIVLVPLPWLVTGFPPKGVRLFEDRLVARPIRRMGSPGRGSRA